MGSDAKRRVLKIGLAVTGMLVLVLWFGPILAPRTSHPEHPAATRMAPAGEPIAAEAQVFATSPSKLAVAPATAVSRSTSQRTLTSYRALRAYPGAPPRIPHALTQTEFRLTTCGTCHERGGYAARFDAYTPLTPHPDFVNCLQCHLPEQTSRDFREIEWRAPAWPETGRAAMEGSPPWIPHDLQLRGNCLSCHGGPGAVVEIRTTHPERANCRQCHVPADAAAAEDVFARPVRTNGGGRG